ncbi:hypothetical protein ABT025_00095 [Streptomyces sp. NPDC002809]|uniref:hypothetical protein n=1 Tax=Streptomyces sp. NPDC002809 TaxID=3154433 RepID=UPI003321998E
MRAGSGRWGCRTGTSDRPPPAESDGTIDYSRRLHLNAPDQVAAVPATVLLGALRMRIDPERSADTTT